MATISKEQARALIEFVIEFGRAAKNAGELGLPLGPAYAQFMGAMSLDQFLAMVDGLVRSGLFKVSNHCLVYIGPKEPVEPGKQSEKRIER